MGTRADFYVGRGPEAEWIGSIALDGYPRGIPDNLKRATTEASWRENVATFLASREDKTLPEEGWPWPWKDSGTTDYAYAFDEGRVWASNFGFTWFDPNPHDEPDIPDGAPKVAHFPNMKERQNVKLGGPASGLTVMKL